MFFVHHVVREKCTISPNLDPSGIDSMRVPSRKKKGDHLGPFSGKQIGLEGLTGGWEAPKSEKHTIFCNGSFSKYWLPERLGFFRVFPLNSRGSYHPSSGNSLETVTKVNYYGVGSLVHGRSRPSFPGRVSAAASSGPCKSPTTRYCHRHPASRAHSLRWGS